MTTNVRVFLSLDIVDEKLLSRIVQLQGRLDRQTAKMKIVKRENIHFTWRFFGDTPIQRIEEIQSALQMLQFDPFEITVKGVGAFPNIKRPRVIWVGVTDNSDQMSELKKQTDALLQPLGYKPEKKRFTPHATIARVRFVKDRIVLANNLESLFEEKVGNMDIDNIRLTKSTLTPSGPIYETLWEIKLG